MSVVLASNNPGKLAELKVLIAPLGLDAVSQRDLGIPSAPETQTTFVEAAALLAPRFAPDVRVMVWRVWKPSLTSHERAVVRSLCELYSKNSNKSPRTS